MAKRYRSTRNGAKMFGGRVLFHKHFFPQMGQPPCDDPEICAWIEALPGFGKMFFLHEDTENIPVINPESIPEGSSATVEDLGAAAVQLQRMGIEVNPNILQDEQETEETPVQDEGEPVVDTLPTLTYVAKANKEDLQEVVKKQEWDDINLDGTVSYLRDTIRERIKEAQQAQ